MRQLFTCILVSFEDSKLMISNFFVLGGYGFFVWPAFVFTFSCFFLLYINTSKELKKQENLYTAKLKEFREEKVLIAGKEKVVKKVLSII